MKHTDKEAMKRTIIYFILTCLTALSYASSGKLAIDSVPYLGTRHYLCLNLGGGWHSFRLEAEGGEAQRGTGGLMELKYMFIPRHWGIGIGAQVCSYRGETIFNHSYSHTFIHDDNNLNYTLNTQFKDWKERQDILSVEVPFSIQCTKNFSDRWGFLLGMGATLSIPVIKEYTAQSGTFTTSGWFESTNVEYEDLINHGFKTEQANQSDEIINMATCLGAHFELGFNYSVGKKTAFYLGAYAHYGITNAIIPQEKNIYDGEKYIGAFGSKQVKDVHPLKTGVKLGLRFNLKDKKREKEAEQIVENRRIERERQKEIAAAAEKLKRERKLQEQRERIRREEENDQLMEKERTRIEALRLAAVREKKEAVFALKRIADEANYAYPNSIPTFPEEIERSFDVIYTYLAKNPDVNVLIIGHTDNTIKEDKSFTIGQKRAEAFKQALIRKGIPEDRMECVSQGLTQPIASNNTKAGRELNNRTELRLKGGEE